MSTHQWKGKISKMEVVEDFESRQHKAMSFVVKREKEMQECNGQKFAEGASTSQRRKVATKERYRERSRRREGR